jgi:hypothetical protein
MKLRPILLTALLLGTAQPSAAYYEKTDYSEPYFILPNESAFFIPDVGSSANQAAFGSEQYLQSNKIAAKRFIIPHQMLTNSGFFSNYFVPTGRLIIVDRTPYNREWTALARGTQTGVDQSFPCQSSEGLNITAEVGIATSVTEVNAARFLYHFGTNPPRGNRTDPAVIFTSVFYGRSLAQVMDTVVRGKVQTLVCHEFATRTLDGANKDGATIIDNVQRLVGAYLDTVGITLDFVGWTGTFTFDKDVQNAINDRYRAQTVASSLPTLQAAADIKVKEGLGEGLRTKGLPSFIGSMTDLLNTLMGKK